MFVKAMLICEDARFELSGMMTLIGVHREHVLGVRVEHGIMFARLMFVTMIGGLSGIADVQHRYTLQSLDAAHASREQPFTSEPREQSADEHVFLFGNAPFTFPAPGRYAISLDVIANGARATYRYEFDVQALAAA
jgi:hypothetical protein